MEKEEKETLYIRAELVSPATIINNHNLISYDSKLAPKYISAQEKHILHFENTFMMLGIESLQDIQRRWHDLPHSL